VMHFIPSPSNMRLVASLSVLVATTTFAADQPAADSIAAGEKRRAEIPLGGDFKPQPKIPALVVVGHGARIIVSKDDARTWTQAFFGHPGADHGGWATNEVAYTNGVFAVPVGWTEPTSYLASDDGEHWRHLTDGRTPLSGKGNAALMPTTMSMAGGKGVFVGSGYMTFTATPDFGKSWSTFSLYKLKDDPRGKLVTHHVRTIYCGDASGRFLALADNRGTDGPKFGHLFASDDLGKTWQWLGPKGLDGVSARGAMVSNGALVLMTDANSENAWVSTDAGATWNGPQSTGAKRAALSVVKGEFWLCGKPSRSSADGKTWRDLPASVPAGKVIASDKGTLVSIDRQRFNILRSGDGGTTWQEVFSFQPEAISGGAQGLRDGAFGFLSGK
jgi:photosystem II stability/assembly factor-like uncharacterized protein